MPDPSADPRRTQSDRLRRTQVEPPRESADGVQLELRTVAKDIGGTVARPAADTGETTRFRPTIRPPMALLQVYDDGQKSAELVRIRGESFVIGRLEGDLRISHDERISKRHAQIERIARNGRYEWWLRDLQSRNGTFVMVRDAHLSHGTEFVIGRHQLRFEMPQPKSDPRSTRMWDEPDTDPSRPGTPCLVELERQQEVRRHRIEGSRILMGRDPRQCTLVLAGDNTISPVHAELVNMEGIWRISQCEALNGLWIRIHGELPLGKGGLFMLGEQQFAITFP